jgi:hypothetical protein
MRHHTRPRSLITTSLVRPVPVLRMCGFWGKLGIATQKFNESNLSKSNPFATRGFLARIDHVRRPLAGVRFSQRETDLGVDGFKTPPGPNNCQALKDGGPPCNCDHYSPCLRWLARS